ncbi:heme-dependent oxidative N-demethylase family protein [Pseudomonas aeruginosa]|uniref:heme-dependent oxidative N-demethylase family protein n=1 Tax=Pseudomonas aeruginosa TaxID=287 RepID=UPI000B4D5D88|nr:DUF3445 domain-containing protein [Pseudomonas aeruginosa]ASD20406.1 hypothetical protein CD799_33415 [Pseudomonas aeruginosa]MCG7079576.1 DUF3445 domain-containing protein [Pseudomonas aeruginosa]MCG7087061.1 DUF3445 domain-containing protein [Pseudomonas aeruginosa]MCG7092824.1 DUF3445 domain-containing protein [Pseudomonas aeruginosa]MCG7098882.1 DUF3445 domain-containing protein [Pseudomonas aeruginosa]
MVTTLKPVELYGESSTYSNSPEAIHRFPFPFPEDQYIYSVNIEPAQARDPGSVFEHLFDIDEHYRSEVAERARVLERDSSRCLVMPHMQPAAWEALALLMETLAADYPEYFQLLRDGDQWEWRNLALDIQQRFTYGDDKTLPCEPLQYITRQVQGDFALLDQRDDDLYMDAGMVTAPADWSLAFDAGMSFKQWHSPVPMAHQMGVFDRALKYLLNLQVGFPVRRLNWTMTVKPRLDTSPETYHEWGADRGKVTAQNAGELVHLRVELQLMVRLPRSHAVMFSIRTYLISMSELATQPHWAQRMYRVLRDLPDPIADYKGISRYRAPLLDWLRPFDQHA